MDTSQMSYRQTVLHLYRKGYIDKYISNRWRSSAIKIYQRCMFQVAFGIL